MMKKALLSLLSMLLLIGVFCSCKGNGNAPQETSAGNGDTTDTGQNISDEDQPELNLPENLDYTGKTLRMLVRTSSRPYHEYQESENASIVDEAVFDRNDWVKTRLGIEIAFTDMNGYASGQTEFCAAIRNSLNNGDQGFHIVSPAAYYGNTMIVEGCYRDLNSLEYFDVSESYWWDGYTNQIAINDKIYTVTGDYSIDALACMGGVFYNKAIARAYGYENDFYDMVKNNEWTLDRMLEIAKDVAVDKDGETGWSVADQVGVALWDQTLQMLPNACNSFAVVKNEDGTLSPDLRNSANTEILDLLKDNTANGCILSLGTNVSDLYKVFTTGNALFLMDNFERISTLRSSNIDYGILVFPKLNDQQESYITGVASATVFAVMAGINDEEASMAAAFLQTMGYASYRYTTPKYFESTLKGYLAQDPQSAEMLDMMRANIVYDVAALYKTYIPGASDAVLNCFKNGWTMDYWFAQNGTAIVEKLDDLVNSEYFQ